MSTETRVNALAAAIGSDVKDLVDKVGDLASLTTSDRTSLVAAINEIFGAANAATGINDNATSTGSTWSSDKIAQELTTAISTFATGAPELLNTIDEIAAALEDNPDLIAALRQLITDNATAISTLAANVGDTNADYLAVYVAARDAV